MEYYFISDIHANMPALEVVLADMDLKPDDQIVCLGDIVGYGPHPNEVMDAVFANAKIIVPGNHDELVWSAVEAAAAGRKLYHPKANVLAVDAASHNAALLTSDNKERLRSLVLGPPLVQVDGLVFCHSSPVEPQEWHYIRGEFLVDPPWYGKIDAARYALECGFANKLSFVGHTHRPKLFSFSNGRTQELDFSVGDRKFMMRPLSGKGYVVVVPSVGQPRDGNPKTGYTKFNVEHRLLGMYRLPYDIARTQGAMQNLPFLLISRLAYGQ